MSRNGKATATKRIMMVTAIVVILLSDPMEDDDDDDNVFIDDTACTRVIVCVAIFVIPDDAVSSCKWRWAAGLVPVAPSPCRCRYWHKYKA